MRIFVVNNATDYRVFHQIMLNSIEFVEREEDIVFITQHKPVITLGRDADPKNIIEPRNDIPVYKVDRGGDVTLHSPGQLMIYPIIKLDRKKIRLVDVIRFLEELVINYISEYGLEGYWIKGTAGVWVNNRKIASIGIGIKRWITYHGMAFNISNDLNLFKLINPCGLDPMIMTSLSREVGKHIEINDKLISNIIDILLDILSIDKHGTIIEWRDEKDLDSELINILNSVK